MAQILPFGLLRLKQILGDKKANPPTPAIIPMSPSSWWSGVAAHRLPQPVRLGPGITCWKSQDIQALVDDLDLRIDGGNRPFDGDEAGDDRAPSDFTPRERRLDLERPGQSALPDEHRPLDWRARLPKPADYYSQHVLKLGRKDSSGWAKGVCPFHDDQKSRVSVNLRDARGAWRCCAACGSGDILGFHMRRTGLMFEEAVQDLTGVCP